MTDDSFWQDSVARVRKASLLDGASLVLLVGVAVPLKYLAGEPVMVRILGPIHGALFLWLAFELLALVIRKHWSVTTAAIVLLVAFVPLGPFFLDRWIKSRPIAS